MWLDVPKRPSRFLLIGVFHVAGAIHAAEHAIMSLMPNFVISMPGDVRTECKVGLKEFAQRGNLEEATGSFNILRRKGRC